MHHSREPRTHAVPCRRCRKPTREFDRLCELCAVAIATPPCTETYFQFDLDRDRVEVPQFRIDPDVVLAELLTALEAS